MTKACIFFIKNSFRYFITNTIMLVFILQLFYATYKAKTHNVAD